MVEIMFSYVAVINKAKIAGTLFLIRSINKWQLSVLDKLSDKIMNTYSLNI